MLDLWLNHNMIKSKEYNILHVEIERLFGRPKKCEHCDKDNLIGVLINWANKSGRYLKLRSDWFRLCRSCHKKYDNDLRKPPMKLKIKITKMLLSKYGIKWLRTNRHDLLSVLKKFPSRDIIRADI